MQKLNLPEYEFRFKYSDGKQYIFDSLRKKFLLLTPEEWVRQNFVRYLVQEKNYPESLIVLEKKITVNQIPFRFDLLVYNRNGQPYLIAEFKAPGVKISQDSFDQVVRYNMALRVEQVVVSNGINHYACQINYNDNNYIYLREIPAFNKSCGEKGQGFS